MNNLLLGTVRRPLSRLRSHGWTLVLLTLTGGCGSTSPFSSSASTSSLGAGGAAAGAPLAAATARPSQGSPMMPSAAPGASPTSLTATGQPTTGNFFTSSWQNTTQSLANTFTVQPKVVRAYDPTSISGSQPEVGADLYLQAGRVLQQQGNLAAAEDQYLKAFSKAPRDIRVHVALARLKNVQGAPAEAESRYREALAIDPQSAMVFNDLGLMYARRGQFDAAVDSLRRAVEIQPNNQRYRNNLAGVLLDVNQSQEAFQLLASAMGEADAHYNLGHLLAERGATVAAVSQFEAALRRNPQMEPARTMLASLQSPTSPRPLPPVREVASPVYSAEPQPPFSRYGSEFQPQTP